MKNVLTVLLAVTAISLLVLAAKTYSGEPPDFLYDICVDTSERAAIRALRNDCDDLATTGGTYNVGIFRPFNVQLDPSPDIACSLGTERFSCLGAPPKGVLFCEDGTLPPCS